MTDKQDRLQRQKEQKENVEAFRLDHPQMEAYKDASSIRVFMFDLYRADGVHKEMIGYPVAYVNVSTQQGRFLHIVTRSNIGEWHRHTITMLSGDSMYTKCHPGSPLIRFD